MPPIVVICVSVLVIVSLILRTLYVRLSQSSVLLLFIIFLFMVICRPVNAPEHSAGKGTNPTSEMHYFGTGEQDHNQRLVVRQENKTTIRDWLFDRKTRPQSEIGSLTGKQLDHNQRCRTRPQSEIDCL
ncbi:hypothetical protein V1264_005387 [Littorina saxatilis]|uniref:Uncharacterized protein n=1 Tax=Littorina saxatilis TaxID=31220 RepID=A0AAN9AYW9_9CAEN